MSEETPPNTLGPTCATCPFWTTAAPNRLGSGMGECHRYPPDRGHFPMTTPETWCGEHPERLRAVGLIAPNVLISPEREYHRVVSDRSTTLTLPEPAP
jgi:hypothetical protein